MVSPYIPPSTIEKMKLTGVNEATVLDVFNNGVYGRTESGTKLAVKKYNGYEVGLLYKQNTNNGAYVILTVWKRERK